MNKIVSLVAILSVSASMAFAGITQKQLDKYMDVSGAGIMLENMQSQMSDMVDMQMKATGKNIDPKVAVSISEALSSDKNMAKFTQGFKALDVKLYNDIISFYATKVGKKSSDTAKSMDVATMEKDMMQFMKSQKDNPFSAKKSELITKITKAVNAVEMQVQMMENMISSMDASLPKAAQMPKEQKEAMISQMKPMIEQQVAMSMDFTYKDYTEKELSELLAHAESKAGKTEAKILLDGMNKYVKSAMTDMMKSLMMELKAKHPEAFKKVA